MSMSSRIIRGNEDTRNVRVSAGGMGMPGGHDLLSEEMARAEKQAFEKGYREGERVGKQMGERMLESTLKRYERGLQQLAETERRLSEAMEAETVRPLVAGCAENHPARNHNRSGNGFDSCFRRFEANAGSPQN
jgi:exonuclease VII small subunit